MFEFIIKHGLTFNQAFIIYCLSNELYDLYDQYDKIDYISNDDYNVLVNKGYIDKFSNNINSILAYSLTIKGSSLFDTESKQSNMPWLTEWLDIFPVGIKTGGIPVRGNIKSIEKKMKGFLKKYSYTIDEIFETTKDYVEEKRGDDYKFIKSAPYFIEKEGISLLADLCELNKNKKEDKKEMQKFNKLA